MNDAIDPFSHHPELRGQIADPLQSFFRTFTTEALAARMRQMGLPLDWWHPDEKREAMRAATLAGRREADLWVFAYGSLMWETPQSASPRCAVPASHGPARRVGTMLSTSG